MPRPRQPLLNRDLIASAALRLVDAQGLEALSTRKLAAELGVSGPSLYNHLSTKEELVDAVVDIVLAKVDVSGFASLSAANPRWHAALYDWAHDYRAVLSRHPNVVPALASGPGYRRHALRIADAVFGGLVNSGWDRRAATHIGAMTRYFITGAALGSFAGGFPGDTEVYEGQYPHLDEAHLLAHRRQRVDDAAFEAGLTALLEGLRGRFPE